MPLLDALGLHVDQRRDDDRDGREHVELQVLHALVVGERERQQPQRGARHEEVGE